MKLELVETTPIPVTTSSSFIELQQEILWRFTSALSFGELSRSIKGVPLIFELHSCFARMVIALLLKFYMSAATLLSQSTAELVCRVVEEKQLRLTGSTSFSVTSTATLLLIISIVRTTRKSFFMRSRIPSVPAIAPDRMRTFVPTVR